MLQNLVYIKEIQFHVKTKKHIKTFGIGNWKHWNFISCGVGGVGTKLSFLGENNFKS